MGRARWDELREAYNVHIENKEDRVPQCVAGTLPYKTLFSQQHSCWRDTLDGRDHTVLGKKQLLTPRRLLKVELEKKIYQF